VLAFLGLAQSRLIFECGNKCKILLVSFQGTMVIGLAVHAMLILSALFLLFTRTNPFKYFLGTIPALLAVFGICSR